LEAFVRAELARRPQEVPRTRRRSTQAQRRSIRRAVAVSAAERGLADTGREASAVASMPLAAARRLMSEVAHGQLSQIARG
jgi:hypothetical protein